ncbi:MAG: hypothetical protein WC359_14190 [Dehalococcoidia bacterium]|jgi:hypothetical protein
MKEIEVFVDKRSDDFILVCLEDSWDSMGDFATFPEALAFCDYHKLTITAYYRNGVKVTKEEI